LDNLLCYDKNDIAILWFKSYLENGGQRIVIWDNKLGKSFKNRATIKNRG